MAAVLVAAIGVSTSPLFKKGKVIGMVSPENPHVQSDDEELQDALRVLALDSFERQLVQQELSYWRRRRDLFHYLPPEEQERIRRFAAAENLAIWVEGESRRVLYLLLRRASRTRAVIRGRNAMAPLKFRCLDDLLVGNDLVIHGRNAVVPLKHGVRVRILAAGKRHPRQQCRGPIETAGCGATAQRDGRLEEQSRGPAVLFIGLAWSRKDLGSILRSRLC
jgi:hypothetical protein